MVRGQASRGPGVPLVRTVVTRSREAGGPEVTNALTSRGPESGEQERAVGPKFNRQESPWSWIMPPPSKESV